MSSAVAQTVFNPIATIGERTGNKIATSLGDFNRTSQEQLYKPIAGFVGSLSKGESVGSAVGALISPTKNQVGGWISDVKGKPGAQQTVNTPDPAAIAAQNDAQRAAAGRQAQIDTANTAPGRGGTILTQNYRYNT